MFFFIVSGKDLGEDIIRGNIFLKLMFGCFKVYKYFILRGNFVYNLVFGVFWE